MKWEQAAKFPLTKCPTLTLQIPKKHSHENAVGGGWLGDGHPPTQQPAQAIITDNYKLCLHSIQFCML